MFYAGLPIMTCSMARALRDKFFFDTFFFQEKSMYASKIFAYKEKL